MPCMCKWQGRHLQRQLIMVLLDYMASWKIHPLKVGDHLRTEWVIAMLNDWRVRCPNMDIYDMTNEWSTSKTHHSCRQLALERLGTEQKHWVIQKKYLGKKNTFMIWSNEVCFDSSIIKTDVRNFLHRKSALHITAHHCATSAPPVRHPVMQLMCVKSLHLVI